MTDLVKFMTLGDLALELIYLFPIFVAMGDDTVRSMKGLSLRTYANFETFRMFVPFLYGYLLFIHRNIVSHEPLAPAVFPAILGMIVTASRVWTFDIKVPLWKAVPVPSSEPSTHDEWLAWFNQQRQRLKDEGVYYAEAEEHE